MNSGVKSRINLAVSYTISEAVQVVADIPELIYNKILITKGDLTGFQNVTITPQTGNMVTLAWEDNSALGNAKATDKVNAVFYCKKLNTFEIFEVVAERSALLKDITLPAAYSGKELHIWMYLNNAKETLACNSNYLGVIAVN